MPRRADRRHACISDLPLHPDTDGVLNVDPSIALQVSIPVKRHAKLLMRRTKVEAMSNSERVLCAVTLNKRLATMEAGHLSYVHVH